MNATDSRTTRCEAGSYGRVVAARLAPNVDLVEAIEALCVTHGFAYAVVRGVVGSLIDATMCYRGPQGEVRQRIIPGPGVELLSVSGEIRPPADGGADQLPGLTGVVADPAGNVFAGRLVRGRNRSFITIEVTVQEWLPEQ